MSVEWCVDVGHHRELRRDRVAVEIGGFVEDDEPGEVHVREFGERHDIPTPAMLGDRAEDALDGLHLSGPDSGDDRQCFLMWHAAITLHVDRTVSVGRDDINSGREFAWLPARLPRGW